MGSDLSKPREKTALDFAWEFVPSVYEYSLRRLVAVEERIERFTVFITTVTIGVPLVVVSLHGGTEREVGWAPIVAAGGFVASLALLIFARCCGRASPLSGFLLKAYYQG